MRGADKFSRFGVGQNVRREWLDAALHWAVLSGTYPFFLEVTAMVGRLLDLQESALKSQLARRCEERFGASTTIARNLEYALWNLVELGILDHGGEKGAYKAGPKLEIEDEHTACLLWKGLLHGTKTGRMDAVRLQSHPALFPFSLPPLDTMALCARFDDIDWDATIGGEESVFLRHG